MSPWNYPVLLSLEPLVDALAAGNTAIIKTSAYAPVSSEVVVQIIKECFDPSYVAVVTGGREENTALLSQKFDYIFFTGSPATGREVMTKAAAFLTPVTQKDQRPPYKTDYQTDPASVFRRSLK